MCCFTLYVEDQCEDPGFEFAHDQLPESEDAGQFCLTLVSSLYDNNNYAVDLLSVCKSQSVCRYNCYNIVEYSIL